MKTELCFNKKWRKQCKARRKATNTAMQTQTGAELASGSAELVFIVGTHEVPGLAGLHQVHPDSPGQASLHVSLSNR